MKRFFILICLITIFSTFGWSQETFVLTETMTATLDDDGVLTISTTSEAEEMPGFGIFIDHPTTPWYDFNDDILSVVIDEGVTSIGNWAFNDCKNLSSVSISNTVVLIESSAFSESGLTSLVIPGSVIRIQEGAFYNCTALLSVTIPNSVDQLGDVVFGGCIGLQDVTVEWMIPYFQFEPTGGAIFQDVNTKEVTLRVPTDTKALYKEAPIWKEFGTIVEYDPTGNETIKGITDSAYARLQASSANGVLHISGLQQGESFTVYNMYGQLLYKGTATSTEVQVATRSQGVHIVVATDGLSSRSAKVTLK